MRTPSPPHRPRRRHGGWVYAARRFLLPGLVRAPDLELRRWQQSDTASIGIRIVTVTVTSFDLFYDSVACTSTATAPASPAFFSFLIVPFQAPTDQEESEKQRKITPTDNTVKGKANGDVAISASDHLLCQNFPFFLNKKQSKTKRICARFTGRRL
jgi:hypothetical protein